MLSNFNVATEPEARAYQGDPKFPELCKVRGTEYLHLVKAIQGGRFQIGNNRGRINGWIGPNAIFGRLVTVERNLGG